MNSNHRFTPDERRETEKQERARGILPLVVGVTGHRDLREEDREPLAARVRDIFAGLQREYSATPLLLLSSLAEGADQLVAEVALAMDVRLIVPLPMSRDLYEVDFESEASQSEFEKLLRAADNAFVVPSADETPDADIAQPGPARDQCYARAGTYIVQHCQILLALWDGTNTGLTGGTAEIVQFKLEGVPLSYTPDRSPLDATESGVVYHLVTPRVKNPQPAFEPFALRKLFAGESTPEVQDAISRRLNDLNHDVRQLERPLKNLRRESRQELFPEEQIAGLSPPLQLLRRRYATVNALAIHFQRLMLKILSLMLLLGFAATPFYQAYLQMNPTQPWVLIVFLNLLAVTYAFYWWFRRGDYQNKYQDYRALAEGLRVQFYCSLTGSENSVADYYLRKQRHELDWIRQAIRTWHIPGFAYSPARPAEDGEKWLNLVLERWVRGQKAYFADALRRAASQMQRLRYAGYALLLIALLLLFVKISLESQLNWRVLLSLAAPAVISILSFSRRLKPASVNSSRQQQDAQPSSTSSDRRKAGLKNMVYVSLAGACLLIGLGAILILVTRLSGEMKAATNAWLTILIVSMPVGAALLYAYAQTAALADHVRQYQRMSLLFANAERYLEECRQTGNQAAAATFVLELGREALTEHGDWVLLHRERPLQVPKLRD